MEENKNDIDELVKSIDSSFKEMSLKDIVATHEEYFGAASLTENEKKEEKPPKQPVKKKPKRVKRTKDEDFDMKKKVYKPVQANLKKREDDNKAENPVRVADADRKKIKALNDRKIKNAVEKEKKPEISPEIKEQKKNERRLVGFPVFYLTWTERSAIRNREFAAVCSMRSEALELKNRNWIGWSRLSGRRLQRAL